MKKSRSCFPRRWPITVGALESQATSRFEMQQTTLARPSGVVDSKLELNL